MFDSQHLDVPFILAIAIMFCLYEARDLRFSSGKLRSPVPEGVFFRCLLARYNSSTRGIYMRTVVCKYRSLHFVLIVGFASAILAGYAVHAFAQGSAPVKITIRRANYAIDDAVRIVGLRLDGNYYDFEISRALPPIDTTPGWLERLEIVVKNVMPETSNKTLVAGTIQVECPGINNGPKEQMIFDQFTLGIVPDRFRFPSGRPQMSSDTTKPPISVEPGQKVSFALGKDFDRMRGKIPSSGPYPDCTVEPKVFHFSDETMWQPRQFYKSDPNSDRKYIKITPEEFGIVVPAQYR